MTVGWIPVVILGAFLAVVLLAGTYPTRYRLGADLDGWPREAMRAAVPVHYIGAGGTTECCGRTPFELPASDRLTVDPAQQTCSPTPDATP